MQTKQKTKRKWTNFMFRINLYERTFALWLFSPFHFLCAICLSNVVNLIKKTVNIVYVSSQSGMFYNLLWNVQGILNTEQYDVVNEPAICNNLMMILICTFLADHHYQELWVIDLYLLTMLLLLEKLCWIL